MRRDNRRGRRRRRTPEEDINPMSYISNLSDVMLILAVGIMLSLVIHWKVDLDTAEADTVTQTESESTETITTSFTDDDLEDSEVLPDSVEKMGNVYYDPTTGKYYISTETEDSSDAGDSSTAEE